MKIKIIPKVWPRRNMNPKFVIAETTRTYSIPNQGTSFIGHLIELDLTEERKDVTFGKQ